MKKILLLGLCIVSLLLPSLAQVGPGTIEFLAYASTGSTIPWDLQIGDPSAKSDFSSPILLSFDVPPSPKSKIIFFDVWGQYILCWSSNPVRYLSKLVYFKITSPAIPNIEFSQAYGVPVSVAETNNAGDYSYPPNSPQARHKGYTKLPLIRGSLDWWWVVDKTTNQRPPDDKVLSYINTIIDYGFRVEVWAGGTVQGLTYIAPFSFVIEVTGIIPKYK